MTADLKEKTNVRSPIADVVSLDASPATVWRALTDAEELTRWFPLAAAVEPGVGGTISLSWGGGSFEKAIIEIWEPNRRLRTVQQRRDAAGRLVEIAIDFFIESDRGRTVLRVVHAGFGVGAEWDEEYDGTVRGWAYELRGLRHYLSRHAGINRQMAMAEAATSLPADTAYARIMGPDGLGATSLKGLREGDAYRLSGKVGHFEGHVLVNRPPTDFAGTVSNLNDALLRYELYAGSAKLWVATWGVEASSVKELESGLKVIVGSL